MTFDMPERQSILKRPDESKHRTEDSDGAVSQSSLGEALKES
jgi:hypothetical protein